MTDPLDPATWRALEAAHQQRVDRAVSDYLHRRDRRIEHPIEDFLFSYYAYKPSQLRIWHPGAGVVLGGVDHPAKATGYERVPAGVTFDIPSFVATKHAVVQAAHSVLRATLGRPANLACFGMHEWAMVYQHEPADLRHTQLPLRLGHAGTDAVVESHELRCTHFDAFRFFSPAAIPRNARQLNRATQPDFEQPGCLHAGMDLYKWAFKLAGLVSSALIVDCFDLAREIRLVDMQASPYDLRSLGHPPIPVETANGKADYVRRQRDFATRADVLRRRLLGVLELHGQPGANPAGAAGRG